MLKENRPRNRRAIGWFSAGITSAAAIRIALAEYEEVRVIYFETGAAHEDNARFIEECSQWYGQEIERRRSSKYASPLDVARKRRYLNGAAGALCTFELKKSLRLKVEDELGDGWDQVFGFEWSPHETNRALRFLEQYPKASAYFPLIRHRMTKPNCMALLEAAGIERPAMYRLGYANNNCIGCFKGGMAYWNQIRRDFPETFEATARLEREIGRSCVQGVFLDELDPNRGRGKPEVMPQCGVVCQVEFAEIIDARIGELDFKEQADPIQLTLWGAPIEV